MCLAMCSSSQVRGCEGVACPEEVEDEEPKVRRMCGGSMEDSPLKGLDNNSPAVGEEKMACPDGMGNWNVQALC